MELPEQGSYVFFLDLKSAYHLVDLSQNPGTEQHRKYFAFKWVYEDGSTNFFVFEVFVFGLSSAPYIFYESYETIG